MAAIDPWNVGVQALWNALEKNTDWSNFFPAKNRIKFQLGESTTLRKLQGTSSDFPNIAIYPSNFTDSMFNETETFHTNDETFSPLGDEWLETMSIDHVIDIQSRTIRFGEADPAGYLTLKAIRLGGPKLGNNLITQVGRVTGMMKEGERDQQAGTIRWNWKIRVPLFMSLEGSLWIQ